MFILKDLELARGEKILLEKASLQLNPGYRAGLFGRNGTGKSSLIQLLLGNLQPSAGEISIPDDWIVGYLQQELPESEASVLTYSCQGDSRWHQLQLQLAKAEEAGDWTSLADIYEELEAIDGYRVEQRAARILRGLGFSDQQMQSSLQTFSGGWQMRVQLARVLMTRADLLLLDEPTNHLDLESIIWLESWLKQYQGTALIISHDRDFLDAVTTHTIHLMARQFKLYQGNYSQFAKQRAQELILQQKENEKTAKKRQHMQSFVDRFRAKASKAKQAQSRLKALEKLQTTSIVLDESAIRFSFYPCKEISYPALSVHGECGYAEKIVLPDAQISIGYGDRIGIIGRNGSGKTTLLKTLSLQIPILHGDVGSNPQVKVGYFSQGQLDMLHAESSAYQHMRDIAPDKGETELRKYLGQFAFSNDRIFEPIGHFSGGEKARLALALLIWQRPNVLILDEPTNHLDMSMRESLIFALQEYQGTVLLVSHDRYLLQACVDQLMLVHNGKVEYFTGSCDDYSEFVLSSLKEGDRMQEASTADDKTEQNNKVDTKDDARASGETKKKPLSGKVQKQIKKIEKQMAALQEEIAAIDAQLASDAMLGAPDQMQRSEQKLLLEKREEASSTLAALEAKWLNAMG